MLTEKCARAPNCQPIGTHCSASMCAVPCHLGTELWWKTTSRGRTAATGGERKDGQVVFHLCTRRTDAGEVDAMGSCVGV